MTPKTLLALALWLVSTQALAQAGGAMSDQEYLDQETGLYASCLAKADEDPEAALDGALTWRDTGGGLPARHCVAVSYTALGQYEKAALELETLADEMRRGLGWSFTGVEHPKDRGLLADVYDQGGNAWLLAGDPVKAFDLFTLGLAEAKEKSEIQANLFIDRALAEGEMGEFEKALGDLTKAQGFVKENADLYVLKASAYRGLGKYPEALAEVEKAFVLEPETREGLLERGNLFREMGDNDRARENWIAYLRLYPDGPAADLIRKNLENMDVKVESKD